ncbi:RiPP maturation radical SAM C-methyltransferase [Polyangium jinanense]|uniref:RiPP maturation radical SAM C-methyltransferase n=1 Tax=Polyangium jinanense TaxID=2829994 RepID=A0A9X3X1V4_9BACT|nr:RiPP maturation radical SAM C-methyltransferase [Polyangium jinanense]MDC3957230.1 RiPP maturation radical SAM C-methyltransferase [Polyangium jinanense]MDC3982632.1 RiPP maturation radical SAM C-methyltransferase [Polyangium jinanense]
MIHLVHMPFGSILRPPLALGLIKAQLRQAGLDARVFNLNLAFAHQIGPGRYEMLARWKGVEPQVGEWLFAESVWGRFGPSEDVFLAQCGDELESLAVKQPRAWLRKIRAKAVPVFLDACVQWLREAAETRVVAFGCTFFQTLPALALGRRLKQAAPHVKLVYGGACFHGEQGDELIHKAPWIDAVSTGEADDIIVPLFRALSKGRPPEGLQGILWRDDQGKIRSGPPARPVGTEVLNTLPAPDFDDFFEEASKVGLARSPGWKERVFLPFESARGCWWGAKSHCTFCGLNAEGMVSRPFDPGHVRSALQTLSARYPIRRMHATDNILTMDAFKDLLPWLAGRPLGPDARFYYCVKSNLNRAHVTALKSAGIAYIQPGIESLSTGILRAMRKGVTGLQNVFLLKMCREMGIVPFWNLLIRVPGERPEDYAQMAEWMPKLVHLWPPLGGAPAVECHRYSPYFHDTGRWTAQIRPMAWYRFLYPPEHVNLSRVAYYFEADWKEVLPEEAHRPVIEATLEWLRAWTESSELPALTSMPGASGGLFLVDTRCGQAESQVLSSLEAKVYQAIAEPASPSKVLAQLRSTPGMDLSEASLRELLARFVRTGVALEEDGSFLALALAPNAAAIPLAVRQRLVRPAVTTRSGGRKAS